MTDNAKTLGLPEDPAEFDLLEWMSAGTIARRTVVIYNRPDLIEDLEDIEQQLDDAGYDVEQPPAPTTSKQKDVPLADDREEQWAPLLARKDQIEQDLAAARSEWTVRALSATEVDETFVIVPTPRMPVAPKDNAPEKLREVWADKVVKYGVAKALADADRQLVQVAMAVESVTSPSGSARGVSVEALKGLRALPHGKAMITLLHNAVIDASKADVEIPRPTSPGSSIGTRA